MSQGSQLEGSHRQILNRPRKTKGKHRGWGARSWGNNSWLVIKAKKLDLDDQWISLDKGLVECDKVGLVSSWKSV